MQLFSKFMAHYLLYCKYGWFLHLGAGLYFKSPCQIFKSIRDESQTCEPIVRKWPNFWPFLNVMGNYTIYCLWFIWHWVWGHIRVHFFNCTIRDELTKSFGIKTKYMSRTVVDWSIYITVLHVTERSKMSERLHDTTPILLDVNVSPKKNI